MSETFRSLLGTLWRAIVTFALNGLVILLCSKAAANFEVPNYGHAVLIAIAIGVGNALLWPAIISIALRFAALTLGLGAILISGGIVMLAAELIDGVAVSFGAAVVVGVVLTVANIIFTTLLAMGDRDWYYQHVVLRAVKRAARKQGRKVNYTDVPGVFFLEIDGLAEPVLRRAIVNGHMPTVARWFQDGSHRIIRWTTDLSSQTSAAQAGLLLGSNEGIPAFRWYERESGEVKASSDPKVVAALEERLSTGAGLLAYGGTSRGNLISGDAPRSLLTLSQVRKQPYTRDFYAYFADPYNPPRTIALCVWDVLTELVEAARQRRLDVRPRIERGGKYPLLRVGMTVAMRDFNVFSLIGDMYEGVPVSYATFVGYDEVAHHSGVERRDAMDVLRRLDQQFARLERVAQHAPRPYEFVVLSDHGQSQGATFLQRYGKTLGDVVDDALVEQLEVAEIESLDEAWGAIGGAVTQASHSKGAFGAALRGVTTEEDGAVALGPEREQRQQLKEMAAGDDSAGDGDGRPDAIVLASGNLGLVYLPGSQRRLAREQIDDAYPGLIHALVIHPGIGFVMVDSEAGGPVAIGPDGEHRLESGETMGVDPLADYGAQAPRVLARNNGFEHAPDVYVVSRYWTDEDEVAAFEELVGSHGGLGGMQTQPFVLAPSRWSETPDEIVGAEAMHEVLVKWLEEAGLRDDEPGSA
ncbi:MAG: phage holin family protein [Actinobacteria bacterium]|nr:phage holin family protein [Actinomycetota bacterium]